MVQKNRDQGSSRRSVAVFRTMAESQRSRWAEVGAGEAAAFREIVPFSNLISGRP